MVTEKAAFNKFDVANQLLRLDGYLAEIRLTLGDGQWHRISGAELGLAHSVSSSHMNSIELMGCVESRHPPGIKGRVKEYRRLSPLAHLTAKVLLERTREQNRQYRKPNQAAENSPLFSPPSANIWAYCNEAGMYGPFSTEQEAESHIITRNIVGASWQILLSIAVLRTTITIERS